MGRVARQTPGDGRGDFTGDGRGGGKVVGQTWRRFAGFLRGFCATASLASVAQDSSEAVERASSWCVLPVSHDSASLPASSGTGGTGDAARGVDSRDTALESPGSPGAESCESRPTISASGLRAGGAGGSWAGGWDSSGAASSSLGGFVKRTLVVRLARGGGTAGAAAAGKAAIASALGSSGAGVSSTGVGASTRRSELSEGLQRRSSCPRSRRQRRHKISRGFYWMMRARKYFRLSQKPAIAVYLFVGRACSAQTY